MERKALHRFLVLTVLAMALVGLNAPPAVAGDYDHDSRPLIAPIWTEPEGQTYGRWAVEWMQWAQGTPAATNPISDLTGESCSQRQVGDVWFLAGSWYGAGQVERTCEIPAGKSLFFPLINNGYGAYLNDPPDTRTEEFVRAQAACTVPAEISVWIDDFKVPRPLQYFTGQSGSLSPLFNLQLPPGNLFSDDTTVIPELLLSPSAEQGYYLFVQPLHPGRHRIRWVATGCKPNASQDIIWHLTVVH